MPAKFRVGKRVLSVDRGFWPGFWEKGSARVTKVRRPTAKHPGVYRYDLRSANGQTLQAVHETTLRSTEDMPWDELKREEPVWHPIGPLTEE